MRENIKENEEQLDRERLQRTTSSSKRFIVESKEQTDDDEGDVNSFCMSYCMTLPVINSGNLYYS